MNRLIADKQKNAFSIIAKALRDSNIPVRTKKQLQQYVGTNTFQEALVGTCLQWI
jgi:CRP-like cAMP-binding protein